MINCRSSSRTDYNFKFHSNYFNNFQLKNPKGRKDYHLVFFQMSDYRTRKITNWSKENKNDSSVEIWTSKRRQVFSTFDSKGIKVATFSCCEISSTKLSCYVLYLTCKTCSGSRLRIHIYTHDARISCTPDNSEDNSIFSELPSLLRSNWISINKNGYRSLVCTPTLRTLRLFLANSWLSPSFFRYYPLFLNSQFFSAAPTTPLFFLISNYFYLLPRDSVHRLFSQHLHTFSFRCYILIFLSFAPRYFSLLFNFPEFSLPLPIKFACCQFSSLDPYFLNNHYCVLPRCSLGSDPSLSNIHAYAHGFHLFSSVTTLSTLNRTFLSPFDL